MHGVGFLSIRVTIKIVANKWKRSRVSIQFDDFCSFAELGHGTGECDPVEQFVLSVSGPSFQMFCSGYIESLSRSKGRDIISSRIVLDSTHTRHYVSPDI